MSSRLQELGCDWRNLDIRRPNLDEHLPFWVDCDLRDRAAVETAVTSFRPTHVIHLAAETDVTLRSPTDYDVNTVGTSNLLESVRSQRALERIVVTSSQLVCRAGYLPSSDEDFAPNTLYGESKVETERITRAAGLPCIWTIIRPTNIWGPWHPLFPGGFWRVLDRGLYVHPSNLETVRSYGYVRNVVHQIESILGTASDLVHQRVLYVGETPRPQSEWVNAFSYAIVGRPPRRVPYQLLWLLSRFGDVAIKLGIRFPLYTTRYQSLVTSYPVPIARTLEVLPPSPISLEEGVRETVKWLRDNGMISGRP